MRITELHHTNDSDCSSSSSATPNIIIIYLSSPNAVIIYSTDRPIMYTTLHYYGIPKSILDEEGNYW